MNTKNNLITHWAVLCRSVSVDRQTNNISIFNVLEELKVSKDIVQAIEKSSTKQINIPIDFNFVIQSEKEINDPSKTFSPEIELSVIDPLNKKILSQTIPLAFKLSEKRMRTIMSFPQMVITAPGKYTFCVFTRSSKGEEFKESSKTSLEVIFE